MDVPSKHTVDAGVIFPDALPKPDEEATIVSKVSSIEENGALSRARNEGHVAPNESSSIVPKELEEELARVIEAELSKPTDDDGNLAIASVDEEVTNDPEMFRVYPNAHQRWKGPATAQAPSSSSTNGPVTIESSEVLSHDETTQSDTTTEQQKPPSVIALFGDNNP